MVKISSQEQMKFLQNLAKIEEYFEDGEYMGHQRSSSYSHGNLFSYHQLSSFGISSVFDSPSERKK
jgi:beta-lactamase class D